jgi:hypothetical protein
MMAALNSDYGLGTRANYLFRTCADFLRFSPRAWLLYLALSGFFGADKKLPADSIRVPMRKIARWLGCGERTAQRVVRELTRSGPLPLLIEQPGREGRVSQYTFIRDPFKMAAMQEVEAVRSKRKRNAGIVAQQLAIQQAEQRGELSPEVAARKLKATAQRRTWNTPTRTLPVVSDEPT